MIEAVQRLSQLLCEFPQIKEIDINPLRVFSHGEGVLALDARMITE
jgi:succinyl-CoA synthetase beta subunit